MIAPSAALTSGLALDRLRWSISALAQPAETQVGLFPDFVVVADELALTFDEALVLARESAASITDEQWTTINRLDGLLLEMSGPDKPFWTVEALRTRQEWDEVRQAAMTVAERFSWPTEHPGQAPGVYIAAG